MSTYKFLPQAINSKPLHTCVVSPRSIQWIHGSLMCFIINHSKTVFNTAPTHQSGYLKSIFTPSNITVN
jgi:hypothetical protein